MVLMSFGCVAVAVFVAVAVVTAVAVFCFAAIAVFCFADVAVFGTSCNSSDKITADKVAIDTNGIAS